MKQGLNRLLPLVFGQCGDALREKLWNRRNFKILEGGGTVIKWTDAIKEEAYGL